MTTTPESWDDVGCLRLQVDCLSHKLGLNDAHLHKLQLEVAQIRAREQGQKKERLQTNLFRCLSGVIFGCFIGYLFARQDFQLAHTAELENQSPHHAQSLAGMSKNESRAQYPIAILERDARRAAKSSEEDRDDLLYIKDESIDQEKYEGIDQEEDEGIEQRAEELGDLSLVNYTSPLPLLSSQINGVFYVCFPFNALEQYVKKYEPVFEEIATSQKWTKVFPFCYIDTRQNLMQHFCEDVTQITFVMQTSRNDVVSSSKRGSRPHGRFALNGCEDVWKRHEDWFSIESPAWFRRTFPADQYLQSSLIDEFINDVHTGELREVLEFKRDL